MNTIQISNRAVWCLLLTQLLAVASHLFHLPIVVVGLCLTATGLRLAYQHHVLPSPNKLIKVLMMLTATAAIFLTYKSPLGLEPSAALLVGAFALKSLELDTRRDFYLLVYVCFFVIAVRFIFDQGLLLSLYLVVLSLLLLFALLLFNSDIANLAPKAKPLVSTAQTGAEPKVQGTRVLRQVLAWLFQAIPLMLLLFFFFPRLAPFWSMPLPSSSASTGMSSFMSPGDISDLAQSRDLVFTATFAGEVPPQQELYWRGLVLYDFDGREWQPGFQRQWPLERAVLAPSSAIDYRQVMQPSGQQWLFALTPSSLAYQPSLLRDNKTPYQISASGDVSSDKPVSQRLNLAWHSLNRPIDADLSRYQERQALQLPAGYNRQTHEFMAQLRQQYPSDEALIQTVLRHFQQQEFFYTLQPPLLGRDTVDEFLFQTRQGFCEHYANAFTVMMRMAGIPARVALGYQGGKLNPHEGFVAVYQYDAHAWSEVWLAGKGWVRVDPTAAVAPSRVRLAAIDQANAAAFGGQLFGGTGKNLWLQIQQRYEQLNYLWQAKVMGFDEQSQENVIRQWLGGFDSWRILSLICGVLALVLLPGLIAVLSNPQRQLLHPLDRSYLAFCKAFEKQGLAYQSGSTPLQFALLCAAQFPQQAEEIDNITQHYMRLRYGTGDKVSEQQIKAFAALCKAFKLAPKAQAKQTEARAKAQ